MLAAQLRRGLVCGGLLSLRCLVQPRTEAVLDDGFVHVLLLWLWLPMIPQKWEDVPWCVSLTLLMQRAQGEKRGVYSVPFFPHMDK